MAKAPKKKTAKKKASKAKSSGACNVCGKPAVPGLPHCLAHAAINVFASEAERAHKRGNPIHAILYGLGGTLAKQAHDQNLAQKAAIYAAMKAQQHAQQRAQAQHAQQPATDPFEVLGLPPSATKEEIRARQKQLAAIFHPDKGGGEWAERKLQEINAAVDEALKLRT